MQNLRPFRGAFTQDLIWAWRSVLRNRLVSIPIVITLSLGMGSALAVFTIFRASLLVPVPSADMKGLIVGNKKLDTNQYRDLVARFKSASGVAAHIDLSLTLSGDNSFPRAVSASYVTPNYFNVLNIRPQIGRTFHQQQSEAVDVILTDSLWRRDFGADPGVLGRSVRLNKVTGIIVGVSAPKFQGLRIDRPVDLFVPMHAAPVVIDWTREVIERQQWLEIVGRSRPGISIREAQAEVDSYDVEWAGQHGDESRFRFESPVTAAITDRRDTQRFHYLLWGAVLAMILSGCVNVQSLLMGLIRERQRGLAVRVALGAGRRRLMLGPLLESYILAGLGLIFGCVIMFCLLNRWSQFELPGRVAISELDLAPKGTLLLFAFAVIIVPATLSGLLPSLRAANSNAVDLLKPESLGSGRYFGNKKISYLVIAQVALTLVLLVGAGLFVRTLHISYRMDLGFQPDRVIIAPLDLPMRYEYKTAKPFLDELRYNIERLPGVQATAVGTTVFGRRKLPGWSLRIDGVNRRIDFHKEYVSPHYFHAMGIQLSAGRDISETDTEGTTNVAVISENMARYLWPNGSPIGKHLCPVPGKSLVQVVGVARSIKHMGFEEENGMAVYVPWSQMGNEGPLVIPLTTLLVRTNTKAAPLIPSVLRAISQLDPDLAVLPGPVTLEQQMADLLKPQRMAASLFGWFSATSIILSLIGIYGAVGYLVKQRRRELAIREALGASKKRVMRLVLRWGLMPAAIGVLLGLFAVVHLHTLVNAWIYGIQSTDAVSYIAASCLLLIAAFFASCLSARRIFSANCADILRDE